MAAGFMTHITCRLTAENRDQLRNRTLCNRVWATFTFYTEDRVNVRDRVRQMSGGQISYTCDAGGFTRSRLGYISVECL